MSRGAARGFSFELRTGSSVWADLFLERAGGSLAGASAGSGLFVGGRSDRAALRLSAGDAGLAELLRRTAAELPGTHLAPWPESAGLCPGATIRSVAFLVGADEPARPRSEGAPPLARRPPSGERSAGTSPSLPVEVQSHWFPNGDGRLRVWTRLGLTWTGPDSGALLAAALTRTREIAARGGGPVTVVLGRSGRRVDREWRSGELARGRRGPPLLLDPSTAPTVLPPVRAEPFPSSRSLGHQTMVLGSTGSGKTTWLANLAVERIRSGGSVLIFDVHGDLAPRVVGALSDAERRRTLAVDAGSPVARIPGLAVLEPEGTTSPAAAAADAVAALKRLAPDNQELYWGFRLERVFDTFVRIALDEGGGLRDVLDLLTDERRREAARLTTRRPEVARFLDELPGLLRRQPEFLWPAASRLSKLALVPAIEALVAPGPERIPLREWVGGGGSILWRLSFGELGPEGSSLVATLLATGAYLALARSPGTDRPRRPTLFVFDEAHSLSPRLLTEILSEGRKFGVAAVVASQYPERLAPELRAAAAGAVGSHVVFRVPVASARTAGSWLGLGPDEAERELPALPVGQALWVSAGAGRGHLRVDPPSRSDPTAWGETVRASADLYASGSDGPDGTALSDEVEGILFDLFERECRGVPTPFPRPPPPANTGAPELPSALPSDARLRDLLGRRWVSDQDGRLSLTPAGLRVLGVGGSSGAVRESAEHRALLLEAFRVFARNGVRLEILRQGRFDRRLPDGLVRQLPPATARSPPTELWEEIQRRRPTWLWRYFGGRDVHVEAEVTGAERAARIRYGAAKAERVGAFALFLVSDARRAARVRRVLVERGFFPRRAGVWTLPGAAATSESPSLRRR